MTRDKAQASGGAPGRHARPQSRAVRTHQQDQLDRLAIVFDQAAELDLARSIDWQVAGLDHRQKGGRVAELALDRWRGEAERIML